MRIDVSVLTEVTGSRIAETFPGYSSRNLSSRDQQWYTHVASWPFRTCCDVATGPTRLVAARSRATRVSSRVSISSRLPTAYRATDWTRSGSNLAESSSFATARAMLMPSGMPGGARAPPENA